MPAGPGKHGFRRVRVRNLRQNWHLLIALMAIALAAACAKKADDRALVSQIQSQIAAEANLKDAALHVTSDKGVVTLSGAVGSDAARLDAYKIAAQTPGVARVVDQMSVATASPAPQPNLGPETASSTPAESPRGPTKDKKLAAAKKVLPSKSDVANSGQGEPGDSNAASSGGTPAPAETAESAPNPGSTPAPVVAPPPGGRDLPMASLVPPPVPGTMQAAAPAPVPQPKDVLIPANTTMSVLMIDSVDSSVNHVGEIFHASLDAPILIGNEVVVPKGADVYVRLSSASQAGRLHGKSELTLELVKLEFQGRSYSLESSTYSASGTSQSKSTAQKVGAGAVIGSIIGAVVGRGKGAAIGAAAGAGAGGVYQGSQKAQQVKVPSETRLDFLLDQPVTVTVMPDSAVPAE
jgi:hypothetical protein